MKILAALMTLLLSTSTLANSRLVCVTSDSEYPGVKLSLEATLPTPELVNQIKFTETSEDGTLKVWFDVNAEVPFNIYVFSNGKSIPHFEYTDPKNSNDSLLVMFSEDMFQAELNFSKGDTFSAIPVTMDCTTTQE